MLGEDQDVERWSTYVGQGAIRFYLPLDVQLANDFFAQAVIVAKDVDARERLQAKLDQLLAEEFPGVVGRTYPLELGPPVGWPVQYRSQRPGHGPGARDRLPARAGDGDQRGHPAHQLRLERALPPGAHPGRPGRGAPARPQLAVARRGAQRRRHRLDRDPDARRHLPDRRRRPGDRGGAHRARDAAQPAGPAAQRPHGGARPVRDLRLRAGVSPGLAPRPGADAHGARRRRFRRPAGERRRRARAGDRRAERRPAAGLSDRARRHRRGEREVAAPRCSPWCR